jgi:hypothetical protein
MPKPRYERKHTARCTVQVPELTKAGTSVSIEIHAEGEKIGEIILGRGSFTWYGGKRQKGKEFSWSRFAKLMDELSYE